MSTPRRLTPQKRCHSEMSGSITDSGDTISPLQSYRTARSCSSHGSCSSCTLFSQRNNRSSRSTSRSIPSYDSLSEHTEHRSRKHSLYQQPFRRRTQMSGSKMTESTMFYKVTDEAIGQIDNLIGNVDQLLGESRRSYRSTRNGRSSTSPSPHKDGHSHSDDVYGAMVDEMATMREKMRLKSNEIAKLTMGNVEKEQMIIDLKQKLTEKIQQTEIYKKEMKKLKGRYERRKEKYKALKEKYITLKQQWRQRSDDAVHGDSSADDGNAVNNHNGQQNGADRVHDESRHPHVQRQVEHEHGDDNNDRLDSNNSSNQNAGRRSPHFASYSPRGQDACSQFSELYGDDNSGDRNGDGNRNNDDRRRLQSHNREPLSVDVSNTNLQPSTTDIPPLEAEDTIPITMDHADDVDDTLHLVHAIDSMNPSVSMQNVNVQGIQSNEALSESMHHQTTPPSKKEDDDGFFDDIDRTIEELDTNKVDNPVKDGRNHSIIQRVKTKPSISDPPEDGDDELGEGGSAADDDNESESEESPDVMQGVESPVRDEEKEILRAAAVEDNDDDSELSSSFDSSGLSSRFDDPTSFNVLLEERRQLDDDSDVSSQELQVRRDNEGGSLYIFRHSRDPSTGCWHCRFCAHSNPPESERCGSCRECDLAVD